MNRIFYLFPRNARKTPLPKCWCGAGSVWGCYDMKTGKPVHLCHVHADEWAKLYGMTLPVIQKPLNPGATGR